MELTKRNNIHSIPGCRRRRVLLAPPYQVIEPAIGGARCLDKTGTGALAGLNLYCTREEVADVGVPALGGIRAKEPPKGAPSNAAFPSGQNTLFCW